MGFTVHQSEFVGWARAYDGKRFHAVLCDPPYGLSFMGKDWDDRVAAKEWGEAMMPLLYPGALVFMFGGTRTWHKLATGMEEAGFDVLDTLMWLYGTGFPKAQDIGKQVAKITGEKPISTHKNPADRPCTYREGGYETGTKWKTPVRPDKEIFANPWQGYKTPALKPAWEPILMFRAPRQGKTYAQLAQEYGSGCLNVDGGRIGTDEIITHAKIGMHGCGSAQKMRDLGFRPYKIDNRNLPESKHVGRYPANLILDEDSAEMLDEQSGQVGNNWKRNYGKDYSDENRQYDGGVFGGGGYLGNSTYVDSGGASRFFYCAKASRAEREEGLESASARFKHGDTLRKIERKAASQNRSGNNHPTVKPISLTKWLATLLLPPDSVKPRRLLVPFSGSGSEMIGAMQAGWDEIAGVEQDEGYCKIAEARLCHWEEKGVSSEQGNLFVRRKE